MSKTSDIDAGKSLGEILSDAIKSKGQTPTFTTLQMEAALCIWEDLLERHMAHNRCAAAGEAIFPDDEQARIFSENLYGFWERMGTVEMRHTAINMSARAVEDFAALEAAIGRDEIEETWGSYDWEWIPAWVYATADFKGGHLLLKDSGTVVQGMIEEHYAGNFTVGKWQQAVMDNETRWGYEEWKLLKTTEAMLHGHVGA